MIDYCNETKQTENTTDISQHGGFQEPPKSTSRIDSLNFKRGLSQTLCNSFSLIRAFALGTLHTYIRSYNISPHPLQYPSFLILLTVPIEP
jgi:hypothetical protein